MDDKTWDMMAVRLGFFGPYRKIPMLLVIYWYKPEESEK